MRSSCWAALALAAAIASAGCSGDRKASPTTPSAAVPGGAPGVAGTTASPPGGASTAPAPGPAASGNDEGTTMRPGSFTLPPDEPTVSPSVILFPPRNEPYDFRTLLEAKYRDGLRRSPISSFVDIEGTIVWTQEYLRYRLNGCFHSEAIVRVFRQIDGFGVQPTCGLEIPIFPPRNEPYDFRLQLELKYRDGLRRAATTTYVDPEGDIVWTQEYIRYRVSGCGHFTSVTKVFDQIDGRGVQPDCLFGGGGSSVVTGTVRASDITYVDWTVTATGTLNWVLTWGDPTVDLDLALTTTSCNDPTLTGCNVLSISEAVGTTREVVSTFVRTGESYRTWIANWDRTRSQSFRIEAVSGPGDSPGGSGTAPAARGQMAPTSFDAPARPWKQR